MPPAQNLPPPPRQIAIKSVSRRVKLIDKTADFVIRSTGLGIILVVALIFVFIGVQTLPLFRPATQKTVFEQALPGPLVPKNVLGLGVDEYESNLYYVDAEAGGIAIIDMATRKIRTDFPLPGLSQARATSAYRTPSQDKLIIGTSTGHLLIAEAKFTSIYATNGARTVRPAANQVADVVISAGVPVTHVHARRNSAGDYFYAAVLEDGHVFTGKLAEGEPAEEPKAVDGLPQKKITSAIIDNEGNKLFVATADRRLSQYYLEDSRDKPFRVYEMPSNVTALDYLIGDVALLIGYEKGEVESWFGVRGTITDTMKPIQRIHSFEGMGAPVTFIQPSARDKGFVVGAADGSVRLMFSTSERTLLSFHLPSSIQQIAFAPKLTSILALSDNGTFRFSEVSNPHPEISFKALFSKVHYEGYDSPEYVWQSTGGTDDFEAKFSLVPLAVGTLKGAFYGLLFAIPIAVFSALYTAQFAAPRFRAWLKPAVEIMAALPSVVVGFIAGLWLAPLLEDAMVATFLSAVLVPLVVIAGTIGWTMLPHKTRNLLPPGMELLCVIPLAVLGFLIARSISPGVESLLFHGDYKQWVFDVFGKQFEQRNSIVIGIAMGFAVIPIIFTISEDAFSNVPNSFRSASFALGASRWQTAWRVILPTASPGVFSAIMIGFGRAVGETMIVLMATGNTPILSFSPFNGMRTLSANIAVEIPEAPAGGTLYRVLFVAALLLFALTFACNTVAEVVRQRLRDKYKAV